MPVFDLILAAGMVGTGAVALFARDRIAAVTAFMVTGLLVALSWLRLEAPDVALAEAAIGAGLTGALFLRSARRLGPVQTLSLSPGHRIFAASLSGALCVVLFWAVSLAIPSDGLVPMVAERIDDSGVSNPVTAVLLNFRAWDTLLEIAVLFAALILVAVLAPRPVWPAPLGALFIPFARVVLPIAVLLAGHLLWQGAAAPGGAFQGGAVLAGGLAGLVLGGLVSLRAIGRGVAMALATGGLVVFVLAALGSELLTGVLLAYPVGADKAWILAIEATLTLSIAATLVLLFTGLPRRTPE